MGNLESVEFLVPAGEGYLVGDILRKYALRSSGTWQAIAYKIDQSVCFGFSNGAMVSYLTLLKASLLYPGDKPAGEPQVLSFVWNGDCFVSGDFRLLGLSKAVGEKLLVCIAYGRGYRTAEQNAELVKQTEYGSSDGFFVIPSTHSTVSNFTYKVSPITEDEERVSIQSDAGVVRRSVNSVVRTLTSLDI